MKTILCDVHIVSENQINQVRWSFDWKQCNRTCTDNIIIVMTSKFVYLCSL